ncbi:hypothetical protein L3081_11740 [Colwellia sp. MSW7]|uniref:Uncharacterized protein n=1 Tax=Colwellia maritima TaxID=2912588 RepID=A0ABS9X1L1_9GAMM|nr:hypothetical protein [Colwellia maritima]MCI2283950.1 hypothetical protein [Colwellia maritima]
MIYRGCPDKYSTSIKLGQNINFANIYAKSINVLFAGRLLNISGVV